MENEVLRRGNRIAKEFLREYDRELEQRASREILVYKNCRCPQHQQAAVEASRKAIEFHGEQQFLKTGVILKETERGVEYSSRWLLEMKRKKDKKGKNE